MRRALTGLLVTTVASAGLVTANPAAATPAHDSDRAAKSIRIAIAPKMDKKLHKTHIRFGVLKPAKATKVNGHPAAVFPISKITKKAVKLRGGFKLVQGKGRAKITRLKANPKTDRVSALINGDTRGKVFSMRVDGRHGFGKYRFLLTKFAAHAMNDGFNTKRFHRGDTFGYAKIRR